MLNYFASQGNPTVLNCPVSHKPIRLEEAQGEISRALKKAAVNYVKAEEARAQSTQNQGNDQRTVKSNNYAEQGLSIYSPSQRRTTTTTTSTTTTKEAVRQQKKR